MRGESSKTHKGSGDSIWGSVIGWSKSLGVTVEHVLYEMSYMNCVLYSAALPHYDDIADSWDPLKDGNDPSNFNNDVEETYVR